MLLGVKGGGLALTQRDDPVRPCMVFRKEGREIMRLLKRHLVFMPQKATGDSR